MALQLSFTDQYGNLADYIEISEYNQKHENSTGELIFSMWKSQAAKASYRPVDECRIPLGIDTKKDADNCVRRIAYDTYKNKSDAQLYSMAKNVKIKTQAGIILDLTSAIDY